MTRSVYEPALELNEALAALDADPSDPPETPPAQSPDEA
jgi:hypothetical protein